MTDDEVKELLKQNENAFGFPSKMSDSCLDVFEHKVCEYMSTTFKSTKYVSQTIELLLHMNVSLHRFNQTTTKTSWFNCPDSSLDKLYFHHFPVMCGLLSTVFFVDAEWRELLKKNSDAELVRRMDAPPVPSSMTKMDSQRPEASAGNENHSKASLFYS